MNEDENMKMEQQNQEEENVVQKEYCTQCGIELAPDQLFCPKCGHKKGESISPEKSKKRVNSKIIITGVIAAVAIITVLFFAIRGKQAKEVVLNKEHVTIKVGETENLKFSINPDDTKNKEVTWTSSNDTISSVNNGTVEGVNEGTCTITVKTANGKTDTCSITVEAAGPDLVEIYNKCCDSEWASVASDGSYLSIDTNPNDSKFNDSESAAIAGIFAVNEALGLPDSIINKMGKTRALDGMQTAKGDGVEISWTYHPDHGLEIIYSLTD